METISVWAKKVGLHTMVFPSLYPQANKYALHENLNGTVLIFKKFIGNLKVSARKKKD